MRNGRLFIVDVERDGCRPIAAWPPPGGPLRILVDYADYIDEKSLDFFAEVFSFIE